MQIPPVDPNCRESDLDDQHQDDQDTVLEGEWCMVCDCAAGLGKCGSCVERSLAEVPDTRSVH